jgi:hypothetical protein
MSLNPCGVAVAQVLGVQVDLQPLDRALDAGPFLVALAVATQVLRVLPVDLRGILAVDANVTARARTLAFTAGGQRADGTDAAARIREKGCPNESLAGDITTEHARRYFEAHDPSGRATTRVQEHGHSL